MAEKYTYGYTAFPNGTVDLDSLKDQIAGSSIVTSLDYLYTKEEDTPAASYCDIWFVDTLSAGDKTILDGIVAAHQGNPPISFRYCASNKLIENTKEVTENTEWQTMGGSVTTLSAFVEDVTKAWGRLIGQAKVTGTTAQIRVIRESDGLVCGGPFDLNDTAGAFENEQIWVNQNQPATTDCYLFQARLNGATEFFVRYFTISLLERLT